MTVSYTHLDVYKRQGWNGVISNHVFPQLLKDRLCRRAVGSNFIHDLVFISGAKLPVGNQPNEDLGGNVFIRPEDPSSFAI